MLAHGLIAVSRMRTLAKVANLPGSPGILLGAEAPHVSASEEKIKAFFLSYQFKQTINWVLTDKYVDYV